MTVVMRRRMKKKYVLFVVVFLLGILVGGLFTALDMNVTKIGHLSDTHLNDPLNQWLKDTFPQFNDNGSWIIEFDKESNPRHSTRSFIVPIHTTIGRWRVWRQKWNGKIRVKYRMATNLSVAPSSETALESILYRLLQEKEIMRWEWPDIVSETEGRFVYCFSSKALLRMEQEAPDDFPILLVFLLNNVPLCESVNDL